MQYLKIENPGVAPTECFTLLGCSTSRYSDNADVTGQFGTGVKHAINLLLSRGYSPTIYCGKTSLEFFLKAKDIKDDYTEHTFYQVCVKTKKVKDEDGPSINRTEELSWVLDFGSLDWSDVKMACREFVSNAIDRCVKKNGQPEGLTIEVVEENQVRVKRGYTRVFIPYVDEVKAFHDELEKRFLNISTKTPLGVLGKSNRNLKGSGAMVYRKGVLVKETASHTPSLFDYNLGEELRIDECRNSNESDILFAATFNILTNTTFDQKVKVIQQLVSPQASPAWEESLSRYAAKDIACLYKADLEKVQKDWANAWQKTVPVGTVLTDKILNKQAIMMKGISPIMIKSPGWYVLANALNLPTAENSLSEDEKEGRVMYLPTEDTLRVASRVWEYLKSKSVCEANTHPFPQIIVFTEPVLKKYGYVKDDKVYINKEIEGGATNLLVATMLEEMIHYITGYLDYCHDMQTFLFNLIASDIK